MGMVVIGAVFVDIKGYPTSAFIPTGRNAGRVEQIHGGVGRNVAEDIANCELRPTFVSLVDDSGTGADVVRKLKSHRVNTDYIRKTRNGMGTWLAVFNDDGDVAASISQRPDLLPIAHTLEQDGDEIFRNADSVVIEIDMDKEIVKRTFRLAQKYGKPVYAVVANMSIALERRDFLQSTDCFVCNQQEAGILFSDDYSGKTPAEMIPIISAKGTGCPHSGHDRDHGRGRRGVCQSPWGERLLPREKAGGEGHHRRGGCLLRGCGHRSDLRQGTEGSLRDRCHAGGVRDRDLRKRLPPVPAERAGAGHGC